MNRLDREGASVTSEDKQILVKKIENKSQRETEMILAATYPAPRPTEIEYIKQVDAMYSVLQLVLDTEGRQLLELTRDVISHVKPSSSWTDVILYCANFVVKAKTKPHVQSSIGPTAEANGNANPSREPKPSREPQPSDQPNLSREDGSDWAIENEITTAVVSGIHPQPKNKKAGLPPFCYPHLSKMWVFI